MNQYLLKILHDTKRKEEEMGDEVRRRLTSGKRIVSEKKKKNTFGSGVTSLTVSTKAQPYKGGDEVPIQGKNLLHTTT